MSVDAHQHFWDPAVAEYPWLTDEAHRPVRAEHAALRPEPAQGDYGAALELVRAVVPERDRESGTAIRTYGLKVT